MKKLTAILLACVLLATVCSVLAFAEDGPTNVALGAKYETSPLYKQGDASNNWGYMPDKESPDHPDTDGKELTDGKFPAEESYSATNPYQDSAFFGFAAGGGSVPGYTDNGGHVIIVDLGAAYDLSKLSLFTGTNAAGGGADMPDTTTFYVSSDGKNFTQVGEPVAKPDYERTDVKVNDTLGNRAVNLVEPVSVEMSTPVTAQYVKIVFARDGWVFVTEFEAYGVAHADDTGDDNNSDDNNNSEETTTSTETTTSAPAESSKPATGDTGIIVFAVLGVIAVAGAAVAVKVRH